MGTLTLHNTLVNKSGGQLLNRGVVQIEHALHAPPLLENESGAVLLNDTDAEIHVVDSDSALTNDGNVENRDEVINHGSISNTGSWCGPDAVGPNGVTGTAETSCLPDLDLGPDRNVDEGSLLTLSRGFHDPGVPTEFAGAVDWGDGTTDTVTPTSVFLVTQRLTASHAYADDGSYTATAEVCDGGDCTSDDITLTVANVPPDVTLPAVGPAPEGSATTFTFTASDAGTADVLSVPGGGVDCGSGGSLVGGSLAFDGTTGSFDCVFADGPSIETVSVSVKDDDGGVTTATRSVSVLNVPPTVHSLILEEDPVLVGTPATARASFSDPGADTFTSVFNWDDGTTSAGTVTGGTTTGSHLYGAAGFYFVGVGVTDDDGDSDTLASETPIIVYDPDAGRLAVGATYASPPGAHVDDPTRTETVRVAGTAGYLSGDDRPSGRLRVADRGDVFLEATAFDWLVVTPGTTYLHGTGEWLEQPGMSFLLSVQPGSDSSGLLRLQVWNVQGDKVYDTDQEPDRYAAPTTEIIRGRVTTS